MNAKSSAQVRVGVTEARLHFADLLKRAQRGQEHFVLEKGGITVAALIGMREYDDFLRWRAQQELRGVGQAHWSEIKHFQNLSSQFCVQNLKILETIGLKTLKFQAITCVVETQHHSKHKFCT